MNTVIVSAGKKYPSWQDAQKEVWGADDLDLKISKLYHFSKKMSKAKGWKFDYKNDDEFLAAIGEPPTLNHRLRRIDSKRGFDKDNLKWVQHGKEQSST